MLYHVLIGIKKYTHLDNIQTCIQNILDGQSLSCHDYLDIYICRGNVFICFCICRSFTKLTSVISRHPSHSYYFRCFRIGLGSKGYRQMDYFRKAEMGLAFAGLL